MIILTPNEILVRAEAFRVIPGIMAAQVRGDQHGAASLLNGYMTTATQHGLDQLQAWVVLWSATVHWATECAKRLGEHTDHSAEEVCQSLGRSAASWMSEVFGVGGI